MLLLLLLAHTTFVPAQLPTPGVLVPTSSTSREPSADVDEDEDEDDLEDGEDDAVESAPAPRKRSRHKMKEKVVEELDVSLAPPPWFAASQVGGGACLAMGTVLGCSLAGTVLLGCVPCVNILAVVYLALGTPVVMAGAGTAAAYDLAHRVARRRVALLPLAGVAFGTLLAGWVLSSLVGAVAAIVGYTSFLAVLAQSRGAVTQVETVQSAAFVAAFSTLSLLASTLLYGSMAAGAAGLGAVVAWTGRDMESNESGGLDVTSVEAAGK